jgi:hypothetical protein
MWGSLIIVKELTVVACRNKLKADSILEVITSNAVSRSGAMYVVRNPVTE